MHPSDTTQILAECADRTLTRFPGTSREVTNDRTFYFTCLLAYEMRNASNPIAPKLLELVELDLQPQPVLPAVEGVTAQQKEASSGNWALEFEAQTAPGVFDWFRSPHPVRPHDEAAALVQRLNSTGKPPTYRCVPIASGEY